MLEHDTDRPTSVIGPLGEALTLEDLPPPDLKRWVPRRKAEVVAAVTGGLLSIADACRRYGLSLEEFAGWQRAVERGGLAGLRATRAQANRDQWAQEQRREAQARGQHLDLGWYARPTSSPAQDRRGTDADPPRRGATFRVATARGQIPVGKREMSAV